MLPHPIDPAAGWKALRARDSRFDGRLYFGVTSTGVYCRPICASRTPRREHCRFFASAAGAERAGFRPCLRCRPELAPGLSSVEAGPRLAGAAAALIEEGVLDREGVHGLSSRLGIGERHLRRVFDAQFGVSPIEWAQTQRLLLAKRLLTDTRLPVTEIALASGFASVRRFNDCFARRYRLAPSDLRRGAADPASGAGRGDDAVDGLVFRLGYRPPLDWPALAAFLQRRAIEGVEWIDASRRRAGRAEPVYRRVLRVRAADGRDRIGWIEVSRPPARRGGRDALELRVDPALVGAIPAVLGRVRRALDLGCRPDEVAAALGELAAGHEGLRLPSAFDGFEIAVRAVLGQQVTVRQAHALAGRVAASFGEPLATPWAELRHAFPSAAALADVDPERIAALGITRQRARTIVSLARALADGSLRLEPDVDVPATIARLREIPGVGDWTAQYLAMRALAWPDAFPSADVGVMRALGAASAREAAAAAERWRPWRAYAVVHLWRTLAPPSTEETLP